MTEKALDERSDTPGPRRQLLVGMWDGTVTPQSRLAVSHKGKRLLAMRHSNPRPLLSTQEK